MKSMALTDSELALIAAVRAAGLAAVSGDDLTEARAYSDALAGVIETALVDAGGRRPGSWEAELGRSLLRNAGPPWLDT